MSKALLAAALAVLMVGAVGCGKGDRPDGEEGTFEAASLKVVMDFEIDPDFTDNSVLICGERKDEADSKYPCRNHLGTENYPCECFNFNPDGTIDEIKDLCPSINIDDNRLTDLSKWEFRYAVYSRPNCVAGGGEVLNTPGNTKNFECFDSDLLWARDSAYEVANKSFDYLEPGCDNFNEVVCVTKNASKFFDFDVCVEVLECVDENGYAIACRPEQFELDCGCVKVLPPPPCDALDVACTTTNTVPQDPYCVCDQGLDPADPPDRCTISPLNDCLLVCNQQPGAI